MMNALLVLVVLCQDAEVSVTGHGRRHEGEYELTVAGKGKGLKDQEAVGLRFRRLANRVNWEDGSIATVPLDDEAGRMAYVEKNQFVHRERFKVPGEVEVRIGLPHPQDAPAEDRQIRRNFRVASPAEEASAIGSAAKRFDVALRGARLMLEDIESLKCDVCPAARKQGRLQKRIEWRLGAVRQEIADNFLTASSQAMALLMSDVENALDLERAGKELTGMMSALTGQPFSWEETRERLARIEEISLRERALLTVRSIDALANQIAAFVHTGEANAWARAEKEFARTIETLRDGDRETRTGPSGGQYAALVDISGAALEGLIAQTKEYLHTAAGCVQCAKSADAEFAERGQALMDRAAAFEIRARTRK
jgi:hypothetical protein